MSRPSPPSSRPRRSVRRTGSRAALLGVLTVAAVAALTPAGPAGATTVDDPGPLVAGRVATLSGTCDAGTQVEVATPWNLFPSLWGVEPDGTWSGTVMVLPPTGEAAVTATCGHWDGTGFVADAPPAARTVSVVEAALVLQVGVGTDGTTCATDPSLTVEAGTTVHWCATLTNLTGLGHDRHTVSSTLHGVLVDDLAHDLDHGASVDSLALGGPAASVADGPLEIEVTWTVAGPDGAETTVTGRATVDVADDAGPTEPVDPGDPAEPLPPTDPTDPGDPVGPGGPTPREEPGGPTGPDPTGGGPAAPPAAPVVGPARLTG